MRRDQDFLLARMGGRGHHDLTAARQRQQPVEPGAVGRRRQHIELEIAGDHDVLASERGEPFGIGLRLREAEIEPAEQRSDGLRRALPARKRARRHPAVDQHHRQTPRRRRQDQIRPQIGFDEQRQARPPVIEKPSNEFRRVVRNVLMDDIGREPLGDDLRRGDGAGRDQHAELERTQPLDQRRRRQHLADAGAVNPYQRSIGPRPLADAAPLVDPCRVFLALLQPPSRQYACERRCHRRQRAVRAQRHRQCVSRHDRPRRDARARYRRDAWRRSGSPPVAHATLPSSSHPHPAEPG